MKKLKYIFLLLILTTNTLFANDVSKLWNNYYFSLNNNIITLPEYIATYVVSIAGYFFSLLILFEILMTSYKYISSGFNMQQARPLIMNFALSSLIVFGIMFTKGVKTAQYTESDGTTHIIHSRLIVDMVSSLFASGSILADAFADELLFGCIDCNNPNSNFNIFSGKNNDIGPGPNTVLNGYIMNLTSSTMFSIKDKFKVIIKKQDKDFTKILNNVNDIYSDKHLKKYKDLFNKLQKNIDSINSISSLKEKTIANNNGKLYVDNVFTMKDGNDLNKIITVSYPKNYKGNNPNLTASEINKNYQIFYKKVLQTISLQVKNNLLKNYNDFFNLYKNDLNTLVNNDSVTANNFLFNNFLKINQINNYGINLNSTISSYNKLSNNSNNLTIQNITNEINILKNTYVKNLNNQIENIISSTKTEFNNLKEKDFFRNSYYADLFNYFPSRLDDIYNKKPIQNTDKILKTFNDFRKEMNKSDNAILTEVNNINKKNANYVPVYTLESLNEKSNMLNDLKVLGFISDDFINKAVKSMKLEPNYKFHWYDLGKYFLGLKTIISENFLKSVFLNKTFYNKELTQEQKNLFISCLKSPNNPECSAKSFNANAVISKDIKTLAILGSVAGTVGMIGGIKSVKGSTGLSKTGIFKKFLGLTENGANNTFTGTLFKVFIGMLKFALIIFTISLLLYSIAPLIFWYIGLINWFFKSSILLVSFCLSFVFLLLSNRRDQIINNIFHLIGQAMVPLFMVGLFFLIINMSNIIDITIQSAIPVGEIITNLSRDSSGTGWVKDLLSPISFLIVLVGNSFMLIVVVILNFNLYRYLWQVDEFVSEVIGTQTNNTLLQPEKVIQNFAFGAQGMI